MDIEKEELIKRKTVYLQEPSTYEMAGCKCGNMKTQWSEYQKHLWCDKCEIDFKPEHSGVFDGPIGMGVAAMFGVHFHRLNLETDEVEAFISSCYYVKAINFYLNFSFDNKIEVLLMQNNEKLKTILDLNDFSLQFKSGVKPNGQEHSFQLIAFTISCHKEFQEWKFPIVLENKQIKFIEDENFSLFKKFILNQKLELKFPEMNKSKPSKI